MVGTMLKRIIKWFKRLFQSLFKKKRSLVSKKNAYKKTNISKSLAPPLTDTDLEFLFTELLEGVYQGKQASWVEKWLQKLEHRVTQEQWIEWLNRFGERLAASTQSHNELASRLVKLGELRVGEFSSLAYQIGMKALIRTSGNPIFEYDGPDLVANSVVSVDNFDNVDQQELPQGEYTAVSLDDFLVMLQQDENLRRQVAQQLGIESDNPEEIIETLISQSQGS